MKSTTKYNRQMAARWWNMKSPAPKVEAVKPVVMSEQERIDTYVKLTVAEIAQDLLYYRQAHSTHEITKLPPQAVAALTHAIEAEDLRVSEVVCEISERRWIVVQGPDLERKPEPEKVLWIPNSGKVDLGFNPQEAAILMQAKK